MRKRARDQWTRLMTLSCSTLACVKGEEWLWGSWGCPVVLGLLFPIPPVFPRQRLPWEPSAAVSRSAVLGVNSFTLSKSFLPQAARGK